MSARARSRLRAGDLLGLGLHGLRARPLRAVLSSLGIAIGIAAMVAVLGISTSSRALVADALAQLGVNLLTATPGADHLGEQTRLPESTVERVLRVPGVTSASATATLDGVAVYRNVHVDAGRTGGLTVAVADPDLPGVVGAEVHVGRWLDEGTDGLPVAVLGWVAAERLGLHGPGAVISVGGQPFTVVGVLGRAMLAPEIDTAVLVGDGAARELLRYDGSPTTLYTRADDARVLEVRGLLPPTLDPRSPTSVKVSRPSDALAAKNTVDAAFTGLLVGVGSIALLVGGLGVANTMVISVIERRREVGLRRALGATRAHVAQQFLLEAVLLSTLGGVAGAVLGWFVTAIVARLNVWPVVVPPVVLVAGVVATVVVGAVAGLLPAVRAARTPPTLALGA